MTHKNKKKHWTFTLDKPKNIQFICQISIIYKQIVSKHSLYQLFVMQTNKQSIENRLEN